MYGEDPVLYSVLLSCGANLLYLYKKKNFKKCGLSNMREFLYIDLEQNIDSQQDMKVALV